MTPYFWSALPGSIPLLIALSALLTLIIAGVVLNRNPHRVENQLFFALVALSMGTNLNAAVLFFGGIARPLEHPQFRLIFSLGSLTMYVLVMFARAFPFNRSPGRLLFWGLGAIALANAVLMQLNLDSPITPWISRPYFAVSTALVVAFVRRNYRALSTPSERTGLLIVQSAILCRFFLSVLAFDSPLSGGAPNYIILAMHLIVTPPLLALAIGYGLVRFQLLGFRFFLSRSLAYFLVSTAALLVYLGLVSALQLTLQRLLGLHTASLFTTPFLLVLLLVTFHPVRVQVETFFDRWLDRGYLRAREAVEGYYARTRNVLELRALHQAVRETTRVVLPDSRLALLMARPEPHFMSLDGLEHFVPGQSHPPPDGEPLLRYFQQAPATRFLLASGRGLPAAVLELLSALRIDVAVPFWREDTVDGVMLLQAEHVDPERVQLLAGLGRHLGLQMQNALLYQQAIDANQALVRTNRTLDETRLFLERLFETVPVGIAVVDQNGGVVKWNKGMERLTGIPRETALVSRDITALIPDLALQGRDVEAARGLTAPLQRRLTFGPRGSEVIVHMRLALFPDLDGGLGGTVIILTDRTQEVKMQEALETSKRLAALGQFAAAMAHEIRTPMTSIQMNVQILAGKVDLPPEDFEYFDIILTELERLNRTVGEVLDFAKPMRLVRTDVDLRELIDEIVRGMYFLLAERNIEVDCQVPEGLVVPADAERLKQVIINLLDNASHALEEKADAVIRVTARHLEGPGRTPGIALEVADDGCGIPPETLRNIFEPFYTTRAKGTGLGLAIARKIAEAHGGQLSADSTVGVGSTFRLWLPGP